jgi:phage terminase large subunit-like protein
MVIPDHKQGMFAINFFRCFGPHQDHWPIETGFELAPYQQFVVYNVFASM